MLDEGLQEFKQYLIKQGVVEVFAKAILDPRTNYNTPSQEMYLHECITRLIDWFNTHHYYKGKTVDKWRGIHTAWAMLYKKPTRIGMSKEELSAFLLKSSKKRKLHEMVRALGKGLDNDTNRINTTYFS